MGAASTGSRLRACFSPMIEKVAIESGMYAGISRKNARNCWTVKAPASSDRLKTAHSGRWARIWAAKPGGRERSPTKPARAIGAMVRIIGGTRMVDIRSRLRTVSDHSRRRIVQTMAARIRRPRRPRAGRP